MTEIPQAISGKSIVLIGLMGAGKSSIGRKLAERLGLPFVDADDEIEKAAGCSIMDIFELYGEAAFRDGERRVIARLFGDGPQVLATGGGAYLDPDTRQEIAGNGISIWLNASLEVLFRRTERRGNRPLLETGNPRATLEKLIKERYPVYAGADIVIETDEESLDATVQKAYQALMAFTPSES